MQVPPIANPIQEEKLVFPLKPVKGRIGFWLSTGFMTLLAVMMVPVSMSKTQAGQSAMMDILAGGFILMMVALVVAGQVARKDARIEVEQNTITRIGKGEVVQKTRAMSDIVDLRIFRLLLIFKPMGYSMSLNDGTRFNFPADIASCELLINVVELRTGKKFV